MMIDIEQVELEGNMRMAERFDRLPIEMYPDNLQRSDLEALWGIKFGENIDHLFVNVIFPEGWKIVVENRLYSILYDQNGSRRAGIFYKAVSYDRKANLTIFPRYELKRQEHNIELWDNLTVEKKVCIHYTEEMLSDFSKRNKVFKDCETELEKMIPDYTNVLKHWN